MSDTVPPSVENTGLPPPPSGLPTPGTVWAGNYQILSQSADSHGAKVWKARLRDSGDAVQVRSAKLSDKPREEAWQRLMGLTHPGLVRCIDRRQSEDQHWFEVYSEPKGVTLADWLQAAHPLGEARITAFFRALAPALDALHAAGLLHLNLRPQSVFILEDTTGLQVQLGGLELATLHDQKDLIPITVDPYYAPPEAAGLFKHSPGPDLVAWDWWSAGRLLQELFLGRHVLGQVLNRDTSRATPELREKAEQLALERLPGSVRAGAVEHMPGLPPRLELLLKGLLASSRDARWRGVECALWIQGESPLEHYNLPTKERCFRYLGQAYTVAEAASLFRDETHWDAAISHLFKPEDPSSLSYFIHTHSPVQVQQRLDLVAHLMEDAWVLTFPKLARDEVLTAMALQQLAGARLLWRGRHLDAPAIMGMLRREDGTTGWLACVRLFCSPPILGILDKTDTESERVLSEIGRYAEKATKLTMNNQWLARNDVLGELRIWELSADPAFLKETLTDLRTRFACSTIEAVEAFFRQERPSDDVRILLGYLAHKPEKFGFITHEEYARRRYQELYEEGIDVAEILFWKRLRSALGSGPWWFGRIWWLVGGWGSFALVFGFLKPGPLWLVIGFLPALLAIAVRWGMLVSLNPIIAVHFPKTKPWLFLDGPSRCSKETEGKKNVLRSLSELAALLRIHNEDIKKLSILQPPPAPIVIPPRFIGLRLSAYASWLLLAALISLCVYQARIQPPSLEAFTKAWSFSSKLTASDLEERPEEQKDNRIEWTYVAPTDPRPVTPLDQHLASEKEAFQGRVRGIALLAKFKPETIDDLILVSIPTEKHFAFAIYDGRKGGLAHKNIIRLSYQPMPRTWLLIEGKVVYVYVE